MQWRERLNHAIIWSERTGVTGTRIFIDRVGPMFHVTASEINTTGTHPLLSRWFFTFKEADRVFHGTVWEYVEAEDYTFA